MAVMPEPSRLPVLGRPTDYQPAIVQRILDALHGGMLLREVSRLEWAPDQTTINRWAVAHDDFRLALAQARKAGADRLAEECVPLVDNVDPDSEFGSARVSKAREQVGLRRWLAGCLDRDTYGDRPPQVNVQVNTVTTGFLDVARIASSTQGDVAPIPHVQAPDVGDDEEGEG